jgi:DNA-binding GntR family transcriptional regulator
MEQQDSTMRVVRVAAPLRLQVVEIIKEAIASGRMRPGSRLVERDLCEMTGVSRTLIREALRQLESEGLVEAIPNKGPIVARINPKQARDVYQLRAELEGLACQLFAELASEAQLQALVEAHAGLREAYADADAKRLLLAKTRFYEELIAGSGNEMLGVVLKQLQARAMLLRATSLSQPGRMSQSESEIADIVKAIQMRDGAAARAASVLHISRAAEAAFAMLSAQGEAEAMDEPVSRIA